MEQSVASVALRLPVQGGVLRASPALVAIALLLLIALPVPVGYVGGGGDDWYYVQAARCAAAHGYCVPDTHWASRWPLVAPMGVVFRLLGDGAWQSMVVPLAYAMIAVALFVRLIERCHGPRVALVAGLVFASMAALARDGLQPNVEVVELAMVLAAANAGYESWRRSDRRLALAAGLFLALAVQARMTSLAWLPIAALFVTFGPRDLRRLGLPALAGFAVPLIIEGVIYGLAVGDPLLSFHLSSAHTRIATSELPPSVDLSKSPLFNPQFIAGWHPAMNIDLHWTINGVVNLLANPQIGPVLMAALLMMWLRRQTLAWRDPAIWLAVAAVLYTGALIYGLAIDPKARMFLPIGAIGAALIGRFAVELIDAGERMLAGVLVVALILVGAVDTAQRFNMGAAGPLAGQWARESPGQVAVEDATRRFLTFDATVRTLPVFPEGNHGEMIMLIAGPCAQASPILRLAPGHWSLVRDRYFGRPNDPLNLCEFSRADRAGSRRR